MAGIFFTRANINSPQHLKVTLCNQWDYFSLLSAFYTMFAAEYYFPYNGFSGNVWVTGRPIAIFSQNYLPNR